MDTHKITRFLKGIAIFFVFLCHSHQTFTLPGALNNVFSFFQVGVQLFMLLSAMGLCFSYSESKYTWARFFGKRLSKIVLPYWFAIVIAAVYRVLYAVVMQVDALQELNPLGIIINVFLLHGFSGDNIINNTIVRGGWFIGAIVILYALFPVMYHLYFMKNRRWEKTRMWAFPLCILIVSSIVVLVLGHISPGHSLIKMVRQAPAFALGFPLYECQRKNTVLNITFPLVKVLCFAACAIILYFSNTHISFLYIFSISVAFFYCVIYILKNQRIISAINGQSLICRFFCNMGQYSFSIYLTHSYIAFDFCYVLTAILSRVYHNDLLWFLLLQPFAIVLSYYVGKCFEIIISHIKNLGK